jgi:hypothetical protein
LGRALHLRLLLLLLLLLLMMRTRRIGGFLPGLSDKLIYSKYAISA